MHSTVCQKKNMKHFILLTHESRKKLVTIKNNDRCTNKHSFQPGKLVDAINLRAFDKNSLTSFYNVVWKTLFNSSSHTFTSLCSTVGKLTYWQWWNGHKHLQSSMDQAIHESILSKAQQHRVLHNPLSKSLLIQRLTNEK